MEHEVPCRVACQHIAVLAIRTDDAVEAMGQQRRRDVTTEDRGRLQAALLAFETDGRTAHSRATLWAFGAEGRAFHGGFTRCPGICLILLLRRIARGIVADARTRARQNEY